MLAPAHHQQRRVERGPDENQDGGRPDGDQDPGRQSGLRGIHARLNAGAGDGQHDRQDDHHRGRHAHDQPVEHHRPEAAPPPGELQRLGHRGRTHGLRPAFRGHAGGAHLHASRRSASGTSRTARAGTPMTTVRAGT
ncbi:MAG: hypothetical protein M3133_11000, partial [Actinomycetota bacterium]|nr:hypothetical protein [Actinomycetota bacterium]